MDLGRLAQEVEPDHTEHGGPYEPTSMAVEFFHVALMMVLLVRKVEVAGVAGVVPSLQAEAEAEAEAEVEVGSLCFYPFRPSNSFVLLEGSVSRTGSAPITLPSKL